MSVNSLTNVLQAWDDVFLHSGEKKNYTKIDHILASRDGPKDNIKGS